jgi:hypothetical protein
MLVRWVRANDQEIAACLNSAVARTCRQNGDIAGSDFDLAPVRTGPAQHQASASPGKSEDLVRRGVIVVKIVYAVTPLRWPSVPAE